MRIHAILIWLPYHGRRLIRMIMTKSVQLKQLRNLLLLWHPLLPNERHKQTSVSRLTHDELRCDLCSRSCVLLLLQLVGFGLPFTSHNSCSPLSQAKGRRSVIVTVVVRTTLVFGITDFVDPSTFSYTSIYICYWTSPSCCSSSTSTSFAPSAL